jgi:hypothetical protein
LFGAKVCVQAYQKLTGISKNHFETWRKAIRSGHRSVPHDGRFSNGNRQRTARDSVDNYLFFMYEFVGEHLAEGDGYDDASSEPEKDLYVEATHETSLVEAAVGQDIPAFHVAAGTRAHLPVKWLGHVSHAELFDRYKHWHLVNAEGPVASESTFRAVWKREWRGILRIRSKRQHAQCHECASISYLRSKVETEEEKQKLSQRHDDHLKVIFADRSTDDKLNALARTLRIVKIDIDGMDQATVYCNGPDLLPGRPCTSPFGEGECEADSENKFGPITYSSTSGGKRSSQSG